MFLSLTRPFGAISTPGTIPMAPAANAVLSYYGLTVLIKRYLGAGDARHGRAVVKVAGFAGSVGRYCAR